MKMTTTNLLLVLGGLALLATGLFRAFPPQVTKAFLWQNVPPIIAILLIAVMCFRIGDAKLVQNGMTATFKTSSSFLIILVTLMPLIGFGTVLANYYQPQISGALKGPLGYVWAIASAFGMPGGSAASGAVTQLWNAEPAMRPLLVYFMTATSLVSLTIYMVRRLGLSAEIASAMYQTNWIIAIGLMPCFWIYQKFFYKI